MVPIRQTLKKVPGIVPLYRLYIDFRLSYKRLIRNRVDYQRRHWAEQLASEDPADAELLGYRWGDPQSADDRLGNYLRVFHLLQEKIHPSTCVLEIGSYGGKWTQYMRGARKIICADLIETSFDFVRKRLGEGCHLEFYRTEGDELKGIPSDSVDLVFPWIRWFEPPGEPFVNTWLR